MFLEVLSLNQGFLTSTQLTFESNTSLLGGVHSVQSEGFISALGFHTLDASSAPVLYVVTTRMSLDIATFITIENHSYISTLIKEEH